MDIKYFRKEPKELDKGNKIIMLRINKEKIYFVIETGIKPSKTLTAKLHAHFFKNEKKIQNAIEQRFFNFQLERAAKSLFC